MKNVLMFAAAAAMSFVTFAVHANPTQVANGVMVNKEGKTLYTFDKDVAGKSNCNGACLTAWPAFIVANPALAGGDFSIVKRDDGTSQWAFQGKPLYFFAGDAKSGDANGDNSGGVWHVIRNAPRKTSAVKDTGYTSSYSSNYNYN